MDQATMQGLARELRPYLVSEDARMGLGFKHDSGGSPTATGFMHGPGGLLSFPGVDPLVFHTNVGSEGLLGRLPTYPSRFMNPTYQIITGVKADTGVEQDGPCDDAPVAGLMKGCLTTSVFGRYARKTPELDFTRLGQILDRADPMDLRLVGSPISQSGLFAQGPSNPSLPGDILTNEVSKRFLERNIALHRLLLRQLWRGNPANNSVNGGYAELTGMAVLVNTGYVDAQTGTSCPSVNSLLADFNYGRLDAAGQGVAITEYLSYTFNFLEELANDTGVNPVKWVIAMRKEMFFELTKVYPCAYLSTGCQVNTPANTMLVTDSTEQIRMRDDMRANRYLMVNGNRYEVVLDDGIPYTSQTDDANLQSGCFASDIYILPMTITGGLPVLYLEYLDFQNPSLQAALGDSNMILAKVEGAFITVPKQTNTCISWQSTIEPRLALRTPWLAARIQHVAYCPMINVRQPFPEDVYWVNGGETARTNPADSYHTGPWG